MQFLRELQEVSSIIGVGDDIIELDLEQVIEDLPGRVEDDLVVLTCVYAGQVMVTVGKVIEIKTHKPSKSYAWSTVNIRGSMVTFTI